MITANSGSITWSDAQLGKMNSTMMSMMRRMYPIRREMNEDVWDWKKRAAIATRERMVTYGLKAWSQVVQTHMWGWSGHVARREVSDLTKALAIWQI